MQMLKILFIVSFILIWFVDTPKIYIAVACTAAFGLVYLGCVMAQWLNNPPRNRNRE